MKRRLRNPLPKDNFFKFKLKHHINLFLVLGALLLFIVLDNTIGLNRSAKNLLVQMSYYTIMAVSLNIVVGLLGELSLGHAGFMCIGAYIGGFLGNKLNEVVPVKPLVLVICMLAGGIAAALASVIIGIPTLRLKGDYLAITTLAFGEIVRVIFRNQKIFGGAKGLPTKSYNSDVFYIIALITLFFVVLLSQNLQKSKHGRAIQAIRDSEISAKAMGVNVTYYKLAAFVIAAFFAGIAGVLFANSVTLVEDASFDFNKSIDILVMVVLGGMGNLTGSIISGFCLTFLDVKLTVWLPANLAACKKLIYAVILIAVVIWNNAPALRGVRERFSLQRLWLRMRERLPQSKRAESEPPTTANWDKIPTKISMDTILSTDFTPDSNDDSASQNNDKPEAK